MPRDKERSKRKELQGNHNKERLIDILTRVKQNKQIKSIEDKLIETMKFMKEETGMRKEKLTRSMDPRRQKMKLLTKLM